MRYTELKECITDYRQIRVDNIKSAKRLLSRLILQMQKGQIDGQHAKDITYLLNTYISMHKATELEIRIKEIEKKLGAEL